MTRELKRSASILLFVAACGGSSAASPSRSVFEAEELDLATATCGKVSLALEIGYAGTGSDQLRVDCDGNVVGYRQRPSSQRRIAFRLDEATHRQLAADIAALGLDQAATSRRRASEDDVWFAVRGNAQGHSIDRVEGAVFEPRSRALLDVLRRIDEMEAVLPSGSDLDELSYCQETSGSLQDCATAER